MRNAGCAIALDDRQRRGDERAAAAFSARTADVARRGADAAWRCVIDDPHGPAGTIDLPEATAAALNP